MADTATLENDGLGAEAPAIDRLGDEIAAKQLIFREKQRELGNLSGSEFDAAYEALDPLHEELSVLEKRQEKWIKSKTRASMREQAPARGEPIGVTRQMNGTGELEYGTFRSHDGDVELPLAPVDSGLSPGELFVRSAGYRADKLQSGPVMIPELTPYAMRDEFNAPTADADFGDNRTTLPFLGTVMAPAQPPVALSIIPNVRVSKTRFSWLLETTRRMGSSGTRDVARQSVQRAQGAMATESAIEFNTQNVVLQSFAHIIPLTEEIIRSEPELVAIVNSEMGVGLQELLSEAVVREDGTPSGTEIDGLGMNRTGYTNVSIAAYTVDTGRKILDAISEAIDQVMHTGRATPSSCLINNSVWRAVRDERGSDGHYIYAHPASSDPMRVWGLPIVVSTEVGLAGAAVAANDVVAHVGAFTRFARLFTMGDIIVETGWMNDDWGRLRRTVRSYVWAQLVLQRNSAFRRINVTSLT